MVACASRSGRRNRHPAVRPIAAEVRPDVQRSSAGGVDGLHVEVQRRVVELDGPAWAVRRPGQDRGKLAIDHSPCRGRRDHVDPPPTSTRYRVSPSCTCSAARLLVRSSTSFSASRTWGCRPCSRTHRGDTGRLAGQLLVLELERARSDSRGATTSTVICACRPQACLSCSGCSPSSSRRLQRTCTVHGWYLVRLMIQPEDRGPPIRTGRGVSRRC